MQTKYLQSNNTLDLLSQSVHLQQLYQSLQCTYMQGDRQKRRYTSKLFISWFIYPISGSPGSVRRAAFDACGCGRSVWCGKIENFLSLRKCNRLRQPHASNADRVNQYLITKQKRTTQLSRYEMAQEAPL